MCQRPAKDGSPAPTPGPVGLPDAPFASAYPSLDARRGLCVPCRSLRARARTGQPNALLSCAPMCSACVQVVGLDGVWHVCVCVCVLVCVVSLPRRLLRCRQMRRILSRPRTPGLVRLRTPPKCRPQTPHRTPQSFQHRGPLFGQVLFLPTIPRRRQHEFPSPCPHPNQPTYPPFYPRRGQRRARPCFLPTTQRRSRRRHRHASLSPRRLRYPPLPSPR